MSYYHQQEIDREGSKWIGPLDEFWFHGQDERLQVVRADILSRPFRSLVPARDMMNDCEVD